MNEQHFTRAINAWSNVQSSENIPTAGANAKPAVPQSSIVGINALSKYLYAAGGPAQESRMIKDKRRSLDRAVLYSYQGAFVQKCLPTVMQSDLDDFQVVRALINPNKLKLDYDDKIISVGFEHGFQVGDVFEWKNTNSRWLIYSQDLTELAYFRGDIRKCNYEIDWIDEDGNQKAAYAAIRGPVETKINYIQKHQISVDTPNYSLYILMEATEDNIKKFKRYSKFYLQGNETCWRVEATDYISTPDILEVTAVEYYANETNDDIENGLVDAFVVTPTDPNEDDNLISGDTFIKVKKSYDFVFTGTTSVNGKWGIKDGVPVELKPYWNKKGKRAVQLIWTQSFSGQFDLYYIDGDDKYSKTIVVESLF